MEPDSMKYKLYKVFLPSTHYREIIVKSSD